MAHLCICLIAKRSCWSCWVGSLQLDLKKWCLSLILCSSWILFFSNFLFALLDKLKGLIFYFHCSFLLFIFHANLVLVRAPPLYSWSILIFASMVFLWGFLYSSLFICFLFIIIFFSWKHETSDCWGFNCKESDGVNSNGHIGILLATLRMNMILY